jgi:hypothetical protein
MSLKNLKSFDEYLNEEYNGSEFDSEENGFESDYEDDEYTDYEDDGSYDDEEDDEVFFEGNLYEATAPRLTSKERQKAQDISQLMTALNKRDSYVAAKEKFVKVFRTEAKKTVQELKLNPKVLKKIEKITLKDI